MKLFALCAALVLSLQASSPMKGHTRDVSSVAISPDGKVLASGSVDMTIRLWDPSNRRNTAVLEGHGGEVHALAFSPDSKLLASGEMYKKLIVWDLAGQKAIAEYKDMDGALLSLAFSPDGKRIFGACKDNMARVWTVGSPADAKKIPHKWAVNGLAVSPDGKILATMTDNGEVNLWDANSLKTLGTLEHASTGRSVAFSPDGKSLVSAGGNMLKVWDVATGDEKASTKVEANAVAITPDGSTILVGTQDALFMTFGMDLSMKSKAEKHERPVTGVAVSPDGKVAYTSSMDMTVRAWNLK